MSDTETELRRELADMAANSIGLIQMTKEQARATINSVNEYLNMPSDEPPYDGDKACLDGWFTAEQLIAIGWWMKNCPEERT